MATPVIAIVDDDPAVLGPLMELLDSAGYETRSIFRGRR